MLHEAPAKKREQISLACVDELVPQNDLLRKIDGVIDWIFIYDLVKRNTHRTWTNQVLIPLF